MTTNELARNTVPQYGGPRPSRAAGVRLLGRYEGSGFRDERYLAARADRQMVLLTKLLYLIVEHADGRASTDLLADRVSRAYGRRLDPADLVRLIEERLAPSGLVAPWNGAPIGGLKVVVSSGWFAARPSGTEDVYKIYAESFRGEAHLRDLLREAQDIVNAALASA